MIKILHNPRCSKSRCALEILKKEGREFELRDYQKDPLNKEELRNVCIALGVEPEEIVRKKEALYKEQFSSRSFSSEEWLEILSKNPILMERPIVIYHGQAVIARSVEKMEALLKGE